MKKAATHKPAPRASNKGGTVLGILIGVVVGVVVSFGIVWYMNKTPLPFMDRASHMPAGTEGNAPPAPLPGKPGDKPVDKPRFDFYKILPQGEGAAPSPAPAPTEKPAPVSADKLYLQLGAFQKAGEADNLKARLALMGVEASVQDVDLGDKGILHRVRAGPYATPEEMNRVRNQLAQNGIQATLVKTQETAAPADTKPAKP